MGVYLLSTVVLISIYELDKLHICRMLKRDWTWRRVSKEKNVKSFGRDVKNNWWEIMFTYVL